MDADISCAVSATDDPYNSNSLRGVSNSKNFSDTVVFSSVRSIYAMWSVECESSRAVGSHDLQVALSVTPTRNF